MKVFTLLIYFLALSGLVRAQQPNVVIFLTDDLGWGDLGCYGHPIIKTPNLDAFAKQGMKLSHCYSASAVCSPSRSAILTGRTPHRNGVFTWIAEGAPLHLRTTEITLPKVLRDAGYTTCHTGKWHLNGLFNQDGQPQPDDHGYDWWLATQNNAAPTHANPVNFVRNGEAVGPQEGYSAPLVAKEAIHWLSEKRDKSKPFFLTVWTHEPHYPIASDPEFKALYPEVKDVVQQDYFANVTQMDHAFGQLMRALDEQQLTDHTFVFFSSDNGPEGDGIKTPGRGSTGGLRGRKRDLHEGGIRVAGLVRWPKVIPAGGTSDVPVIGSDLFPTALAVAGVSPPTERVLDGANVLPVLRGESESVQRSRPLYWRLRMAPNAKVAMRVDDWKILANDSLTEFELYNLKADPTETTDRKEQEVERFNAMRQQLVELDGEIRKEGPEWCWTLSESGGQDPSKVPTRKKKAKAKN
jgi:arylsulfatase A